MEEVASASPPLTDEEVISLLDSNGIACDPATAIAIVKIVERAHGIDWKWSAVMEG